MATSVQAAVHRLAAAPMRACAWFEGLNDHIGSANHPGQAIQPSCKEETVGVRNHWSVPHRHQGPQARGADGCSQLMAALSQWGPLNTDTTINWDSLIAAESCCLTARGAGEHQQPVHCPTEAGSAAGISLHALGYVWRHMLPQSAWALVCFDHSLQVASEGFSWGRRCQGH